MCNKTLFHPAQTCQNRGTSPSHSLLAEAILGRVFLVTQARQEGQTLSQFGARIGPDSVVKGSVGDVCSFSMMSGTPKRSVSKSVLASNVRSCTGVKRTQIAQPFSLRCSTSSPTQSQWSWILSMSRWELMAETRHILVTVFVVAPNYTCIYCLMIFYHKRRDIFLNVVWTGGPQWI